MTNLPFDIVYFFCLFLLVAAILWAGLKTVPQGWTWTVERLGRHNRNLTSGFNLIVPFIDRIGRKVNMMERVIETPDQEVFSRDNVAVTVTCIVSFQVLDAAKASYEIMFPEQAITNLTLTNMRSVMSVMELGEILSHRAFRHNAVSD